VKYSIDTSALLDGWIRFYPPDRFPPLWKKFKELIDLDILKATEIVKMELEKKDDEVLGWAKSNSNLFIPLDDQIQIKATEILDRFPRLVDTRSNRTYADPFVIALAQIEDLIVITGEHLAGNLEKPNIPDICRHFNIEFINLLELMRREDWIFGIIESP